MIMLGTTPIAAPMGVPRSGLRSESAAPRLRVRGLNAWHGTRRTLHDITVDFAAHSVTALVGPSGCGKSTLLRCLNRLHEVLPDTRVSGEVLLDGLDLYAPDAAVEATRRALAMVFQRPTPFPAWTILENVLAGLAGTPAPRTLARDRLALAERALRAAGVWDDVRQRLHDNPLTLSGGQQQRLCVARALATTPAVLLLDEPTSALDPVSSAHLEQTFSALRAELTIVLVTHDIQQALRLADHVLVLWNGNIIASGAPNIVLEHSSDPRIRSLVGH
jgi:phosphate transport system ATP-binding protein